MRLARVVVVQIRKERRFSHPGRNPKKEKYAISPSLLSSVIPFHAPSQAKSRLYQSGLLHGGLVRAFGKGVLALVGRGGATILYGKDLPHLDRAKSDESSLFGLPSDLPLLVWTWLKEANDSSSSSSAKPARDMERADRSPASRMP
ncbi:hypothetical protein H5410_036252 [Solanum commersonii]|uniref:Uncharacterized protein n=1 Tax=Solanum commersonii TaxID=4109 RepID=A0A9J5Y6Z2_SOLCO|nr:hypothetical protein H5410_036252 [Solanum commersonii]